MAFDKDSFLTALDSMTVMELNDLVKAIEEKFGVSAAAMAAPATSPPHAAPARVKMTTPTTAARRRTLDWAGIIATLQDWGVYVKSLAWDTFA